MNIAKFRNDQVKDQKEDEYLAKVFDRIWKYKDQKWTEKNYMVEI